MKFKPLVSSKTAPWFSAALIIASTLSGVIAGNLGGESESCVVRSELTERFGTRPFQLGLSTSQLTYEASVYAELARLAPDKDKKREFAYLATMKVNSAIDEVAELTSTKPVMWRFPSDAALGDTAYHEAFARHLDGLKLEQLRSIAAAFDTDLPQTLELQRACNHTEGLKFLWSFLTAILAIASVVFVTVRERGRNA